MFIQYSNNVIHLLMKTETITFRTTAENKQRLFKEAKQDKRTLSNFIIKKLSDDSK